MESPKSRAIEGAPVLFTFFVALPFPCPLQHGAVVSRLFEEPLEGCDDMEVRATDDSVPLASEQKNHIFASLKFWQLRDSVDAADSLRGILQVVHEVTGVGKAPDEPVPLPQETYRTVVEMVTPQNADKLEDMKYALKDAFERCFGVLSDVYSMSRLVMRDAIPPRVGVEEARTVVWFGRFPGEKYNSEFGGIFAVSPPPHYPDETMNDAEFSQFQTLLQRVWNGSPLELMMEHSLVARQFLDRQGDYANAVIHAALASEVLLDSLLGLLMWEEQVSSPNISIGVNVFDEAKNGGLTSRVKREYGSRLGGNWNPATNGPVKGWSVDLAYLRGRVVHRGYRPTRSEAERALEASDRLLEFVKVRLAMRSDKYPRTCLMILGEPGLRRIGGWKAAHKFLEESDEHPLKWFSGYSAWRDDVDAARLSS